MSESDIQSEQPLPEDVRADFEEVQELLAGIKEADKNEAYRRLELVFGTAGLLLSNEPQYKERVKQLLDSADCWGQIWQTERGSEYYVLRSGVMLRWKVGWDVDFSPSGPREPTVPICFLPEDTARAVTRASDNEYTGRILSARPNEENPVLSLQEDEFSYERSAGVTRWKFKGASLAPTIGLAPFDFQRSPEDLPTTITTDGDMVTVEIHHNPQGRFFDYRATYHVGDKLVKITDFEEDAQS